MFGPKWHEKLKSTKAFTIALINNCSSENCLRTLNADVCYLFGIVYKIKPSHLGPWSCIGQGNCSKVEPSANICCTCVQHIFALGLLLCYFSFYAEWVNVDYNRPELNELPCTTSKCYYFFPNRTLYEPKCTPI